MCAKLEKLRATIPPFNSNIICLSETWLNNSISSTELGLSSDYNIHRKDRSQFTSSKSRGGGVLLAVNNELISHAIDPVHKDIEQIFVGINVSRTFLIVGCVYLPPNSPLVDYENHCSELGQLLMNYPDALFIICGD